MNKVTTLKFGTLAVAHLQPQAPMTQKLEWKTDLSISYNGTESSQRLRAHPRQKLTLQYPEPIGSTQSEFIQQYTNIRSKWVVPMWTQSQRVQGVTGGASVIQCDTTNEGFRDGSLAFLYVSAETWQVVEIETVEDGELHLSSPVGSFPTAWLMPAVVGSVVNNFVRKSKGHSAITDITFEVEDVYSWPGTPSSYQYKGQDLYLEPTLFQGSEITSNILTKSEVIDYELGVIARRFPWRYNRILRPRHVLCNTRKESYEYIDWLMRRCGRARYYWEPSFESDLTVKSSGVIGGVLTVGPEGLPEGRNHIAIKTKTGLWLMREIIERVRLNASSTELHLDSAVSILATDISFISYMGLKRLDTDAIDLVWIGNGVLESTVNSVEVQP